MELTEYPRLNSISGEIHESGELGRLYGKPIQIFVSKFVIGQTIFNVVMSFLVPTIMFYLLFYHKAPHYWLSGNVLGPVLASPWCCSIGSLAFAPMGIPDALDKKWFYTVRNSDVSTLPWTLFPYLRFRIGIIRHLVLGTQVAVLAIPIMFIIIRFGFGEYLSANQQLFGGVTYIAILPIFVMPLGLLGFAVDANMSRVRKNVRGNIIQKALKSPIC
eukprot:NODE_6958_length_824_cov_26.350927_g6358_i0.p1 GENE.NODE_6958_length_824_cov_26.350927_g6358_i0~~NODE_6958_length_824_cov_26.350927_g6358_i0.p1  ORF type:complete len:217 (-),score=17.89 NODE_6958_length_824_cov_26.350927_g6358_i0:115-765(-)